MICSGDLTLVGSGGDLMRGSSSRRDTVLLVSGLSSSSATASLVSEASAEGGVAFCVCTVGKSWEPGAAGGGAPPPSVASPETSK